MDLGLTHLATLSTGEKIPNPRHYHARLSYLRQQQRCFTRREKGSRRREKQRLRVARAHAQVRRARQAALPALTSRLVYEFDLICIKDLNVTGLARGRHSRAIQEVAFSEIRRQLAYKCEWYGKILEPVNRWYASSKTCSKCRHKPLLPRRYLRGWLSRKSKPAESEILSSSRPSVPLEIGFVHFNDVGACDFELTLHVVVEGDDLLRTLPIDAPHFAG